jgi:ribonuclease HII
MQYVIGIDEAGRGALAGPVSVGAVCIPRVLGWDDFPGLKDSKQLTPKKRDEWLATIQSDLRLSWAVSFSSPGDINEKGIVWATNTAATKSAQAVTRASGEILCDAGLKIAHPWPQRAIVRGDETEVAIALASVVAKVLRDRYMAEIAALYPQYELEIHKGYGTKRHREAIRTHGPVDGLHRTLFIRNLTQDARVVA